MNGTSYAATVIYLGLNWAPLVWTLMLQPLFSMLAAWGMTVTRYIDDILGISNSFQAAEQDVARTCLLLEKAGLIINTVKSSPTPSLQKDHLGLTIDARLFQFKVPRVKALDISNFAGALAKRKEIKAETLAKFFGKISSLSLAYRPHRRFSTNLLQCLYSNGTPWGKRLVLTEEAINDLCFLAKDLLANQARSIRVERCLVVMTDACTHCDCHQTPAWGAFIPALNTFAQGHFTEQLSHIQLYELLAPIKALEAGLIPADTPWVLMSDNVSTVFYARNFGKAGPQLQMKALAFQLYALTCSIKSPLENVLFIPGQLNLAADYLSRCHQPLQDVMEKHWKHISKRISHGKNGWISSSVSGLQTL